MEITPTVASYILLATKMLPIVSFELQASKPLNENDRKMLEKYKVFCENFKSTELIEHWSENANIIEFTEETIVYKVISNFASSTIRIDITGLI